MKRIKPHVAPWALFLVFGLFSFLLPLSTIRAEETAEPTATPNLSQVYEEESVSINGDRGERILRVQQRLKDLGYLNYRPTGYYMSMTLDAVQRFQQRNNITLDQVIGPETMTFLFGNHPVRSAISSSGGSAPKGQPYPNVGEPLSWESMQILIPLGTSFTITDRNTSISFSAQRAGGENHMDLSFPNASDRTKCLSLFGGVPQGDRRAVIVSYGGKDYAASLSITFHGGQGVACLYFRGSRSHGLGIVDTAHDANIKKASGQ